MEIVALLPFKTSANVIVVVSLKVVKLTDYCFSAATTAA